MPESTNVVGAPPTAPQYATRPEPQVATPPGAFSQQPVPVHAHAQPADVMVAAPGEANTLTGSLPAHPAPLAADVSPFVQKDPSRPQIAYAPVAPQDAVTPAAIQAPEQPVTPPVALAPQQPTPVLEVTAPPEATPITASSQPIPLATPPVSEQGAVPPTVPQLEPLDVQQPNQQIAQAPEQAAALIDSPQDLVFEESINLPYEQETAAIPAPSSESTSPKAPLHGAPENIYSHYTRLVWHARRSTKLANLAGIIFLLVLLGGLFIYWIAIGAPTRLEDIPFITDLIS